MGMLVAAVVLVGVLVLATVVMANGLVALLVTGTVFGVQATINRNRDDKSQACFMVNSSLYLPQYIAFKAIISQDHVAKTPSEIR